MSFEAGPVHRVGSHLFGDSHHNGSEFGLDFEILLGCSFGNHQSNDFGVSQAAGPNEGGPSLLVVLYVRVIFTFIVKVCLSLDTPLNLFVLAFLDAGDQSLVERCLVLAGHLLLLLLLLFALDYFHLLFLLQLNVQLFIMLLDFLWELSIK